MNAIQKLTARLALSQLKVNRRRTNWTLGGIILSAAMINAVYSLLASFYAGLAAQGFFGGGSFMLTMLGDGAAFSMIIICVSVNVVSNAFRVSAAERTAQFGILKSVGATKRQIAETVIYEGLMLSAIGVPLGIALGLLTAFVGVGVTTSLLAAWNRIDDIGYELAFRFVVSWEAIVLSAALSFITVLLSAWLPARKAAQTPAIEAIRGSGVFELGEKRPRPMRLVGRLFGFEGVLAAKSLRRNRRVFRASVISLTLSVVLFAAVSGLSAQADGIGSLFYPDIASSVSVQAISAFPYSYDEDGDIADLTYIPVNGKAEQMTERLRAFGDGTDVIGVGGFYRVTRGSVPEDMLSPEMAAMVGNGSSVSVWLLTVDELNYAKLCEQAGVPQGSNLLLNHFEYAEENGRKSALTPYVFDGQSVRVKMPGSGETEIRLHGEVRDVPPELTHGFTEQENQLTVIMPNIKLEAIYYNWFASPGDTGGFMDYAADALDELVPKSGKVNVFTGVYDMRDARDAQAGIIGIIKLLCYSFAAMLTLIALTNVISTISANIRSRSREFAILKSVGMTHEGLGRMLDLESALSSAKSLAIGLPLGLLAACLIHRIALIPLGFGEFRFPWLTIVYCALGVFAITWGAMRFTLARIRGGSIIEKIRKDAV